MLQKALYASLQPKTSVPEGNPSLASCSDVPTPQQQCSGQSKNTEGDPNSNSLNYFKIEILLCVNL